MVPAHLEEADCVVVTRGGQAQMRLVCAERNSCDCVIVTLRAQPPRRQVSAGPSNGSNYLKNAI